MKKEIILLVGNIGSGKSTLAKQYAEKGYIVISRDSIRYMIGGGNYRYDLRLEPTVRKSAREMLKLFLKKDCNIVCDETNVSRYSRKEIINLAKKYNYKITTIILSRVSKETCVNRRMSDPHGQFDRKLWEKVWDQFDFGYEEPSKKEGIDKIVRMK